MIYSSINPRVHLLRTAEHEHEHTMLDFSENRARGYYSREFGVSHKSMPSLLRSCELTRLCRFPDLQIWSVRFSADQKEIVAGAGSGQIMIYDIEAKRRILNIAAHNQDGEYGRPASRTVWPTEGPLCDHSQRSLLCRRKFDQRHRLGFG